MRKKNGPVSMETDFFLSSKIANKLSTTTMSEQKG